MAWYDQHTGTAGTMRITDTGTTVQFWILCTDSQTSTGAFIWSGVVNGVGVGGSVSLPRGFGQKLLGEWAVSYTQTVTYHMNATGTQGLGGPTDHAAAITRQPPVVPPAPIMRPPADIQQTSMMIYFDGQGQGGGTFLGWDLQWATDAAFTQNLHQEVSSGTTRATDLWPGTPYWFRARGVNTIGPGAWAVPVTAATLPAVFVSDGSAWQPAQVLVSDGEQWLPGQVLVSDGAAWKPAG